MKLRHQYKIEFPDTVKPVRHAYKVDVEVACECSFPKADQAAQDLKSRDKDQYEQYKKLMLEGFLAKTTEAFFSKFDEAAGIEIKANYKDLMNLHGKVNYTEAEWKPIIEKFSTAQEIKIKALFIKMLTKTTDAVAAKSLEILKELDQKEEGGREKVATLTAKEAFANFQSAYGLKFAMSSKFENDHMLDQLSKKQVQEASAERYWKNGTTTCSWNELTEAKVLNKARNGKAVPTVFKGGQQLAVTIKATEKIGKVSPWDPKKDGKNGKPADLWESKGKTSVTVEVTEKTKEFMLIGKYTPENGEAEIYHYEPGSAPDNPEMLDKYLKWKKIGDKVVAWKEKY